MAAVLSKSNSSSFFRQHLPFLRFTMTLQISVWSNMAYHCSNTGLCGVNTNPNHAGTWYIEFCLQVWIFSKKNPSPSFKLSFCLEIIIQLCVVTLTSVLGLSHVISISHSQLLEYIQANTVHSQYLNCYAKHGDHTRLQTWEPLLRQINLDFSYILNSVSHWQMWQIYLCCWMHHK